jgi:hypothetical protein
LTWETFPNRFVAIKVEKEAIRAERPPFNVAHNLDVEDVVQDGTDPSVPYLLRRTET